MDSAALSFTDKEKHFIASKQEHNISLESCPPYAHWENGIVEKAAIQTLRRGTRTRLRQLIGKPWYKTKIIKKS